MSPAGISVRTAVPGDRAAILELSPRLAEGVAPWRDQREARQAGRNWLNSSLERAAEGTGAVFVAVDPGAGVVGVVAVEPSRHFTGENDGYIGELVVAEQAAGRGTGRALVEAAEDWADRAGLAHLTLHTGAYNAAARAFYAALGFAEEEVRLTRPVRRRDPGK